MKKTFLLLLFLLGVTTFGAVFQQSMSLNSFNAGELSPLMNARSDFVKYKLGAKTLENMVVTSQGPVSRRPGTKYIATVRDSNDPTRIIPFEYSTTDAYIIELDDGYMRFYKTDVNGLSGQILDPNLDAYEIVSPYDSNDVFEIQFCQTSDMMRLVHGDYPPQKLTRTGDAAWEIAQIDFTTGPFLDQNKTAGETITPSDITGDDITLTATGFSTGPFNDDLEGALWQISHVIDANSTTGSFTSAPANSSTIAVENGREFYYVTHGTWTGTILCQRSYDDGASWIEFGPPSSYANDGNIQYSGIEDEDDAIYRLRMTAYTSGTCTYTLTAKGFVHNGVVRIDTYKDANTVTADVITDLGEPNATWRWAEGAWSDYRGWPQTIELHEERIFYGGNASYPQTIWSSVTAEVDDDFDDMTAGALDSDALIYVLPGYNPIRWMVSHTYLMVGTMGSVGRLGFAEKGLTPTDVDYKSQAQNGSAAIKAVKANNAILYIERGEQKVREILYSYETEGFSTSDMTILSEHVLGTGVVDMAFQNRPFPILWCVRDDGDIATFTYQRDHDVTAWSRINTGASGDFESVATMPSPNEDEVWAVVQRTVDSNDIRYVEQFQPFDWGTDQNDCYFVDCGVDDITNLSHLEGETVALFANGRPIGTFTVDSGEIDPNDPNLTEYTVGLPYTSIFETVPLVMMTQFGSTASKYAKVLDLNIDFYETLGCHVGADSSHVSDIKFSPDSFATTIDVFSGLKYAPYPRGTTQSPRLYMTESDPVPLTIRGIYPKIEVTFE